MSAARRPAIDIISHSPDQTRRFGAQLGRLLRRGDVVLLSGDIGAGKTTFVQGVARALQVAEPAQSPTFTIVAEHAGRGANGAGPLRLYHIDLYRLNGVEDVESFGFDEYLDGRDSLAAIEWPERARAAMPEEHLLVELRYLADQKRQLQLLPRGRRYAELVEHFRQELAGAHG